MAVTGSIINGMTVSLREDCISNGPDCLSNGDDCLSNGVNVSVMG